MRRRRLGRRCDRVVRLAVGHLYGDGRVVEEHIFDREKVDLEMLVDQQTPLPGAVDEQIAFHAFPGLERDGNDVTVVGRLDAGDIRLDVPDPETPDRVLLQQPGELAGIEMVAVVDVEGILGRGRLLGRETGRNHFSLRRDEIRERDSRCLVEPEPGQVEIGILGRKTERVNIPMIAVDVRPVDEPGALLEARVAVPEQAGLGYPDRLQRLAHRRPGALTDADRRDVGRLDQHDLETAIVG